MNDSVYRLIRILTLASAAATPIAHASTVLDFEDPSLVNIYEDGQSFDQSGFRMTQTYDSGIVDTGDALGDVAPTNNFTQFYTSLNDGEVELSRVDGGTFSLDGFSAAYVPTQGSTDINTMVLIVNATAADGSYSSYVFGLGDTRSNTHGDPFFIYGDRSFFSGITNLAYADFYTCDLINGALCDTPISNTAGFALDNIMVTPLALAVPEPTTCALMVFGLAGLALARRRTRRSSVQGTI